MEWNSVGRWRSTGPTSVFSTCRVITPRWYGTDCQSSMSHSSQCPTPAIRRLPKCVRRWSAARALGPTLSNVADVLLAGHLTDQPLPSSQELLPAVPNVSEHGAKLV